MVGSAPVNPIPRAASFAAFRAAFRSSAFEMQMAQFASPVMLTTVRPISRIRSIPAMRAIPSSGSPALWSTMESMMTPEPGTPAVPTDASVAVRTTMICCVRDKWIPNTLAIKMAHTPW